MEKYLVQAILIANGNETITDSFKTNDYAKTLEFVMTRHRHSNKYLYTVLEIATQEVVFKSSLNPYFI